MSGKCAAHFDNDNEQPTKLRRMCKHIESESESESQSEPEMWAEALHVPLPPVVSPEDVPTTSFQKNVSHGNGDSGGNGTVASQCNVHAAATENASLGSASAPATTADDPPHVVNHHDGSGSEDGGSNNPSSSSESDPGPIHCSVRVQRMITVIIDNRFCCRYFFQHSFSGALTPRHPNAPFWAWLQGTAQPSEIEGTLGLWWSIWLCSCD